MNKEKNDHLVLNPQPTFRVSGHDAAKFLSSVCTNGFDNFQIGTARHGIMCNGKGQIMKDGLLIRTGEDMTGQIFLYQIGGPKSLEILEQAAREDLHDIGYLRHRMSEINGKAARIVRIGMAGALAYEAHGDIADAHGVYNRPVGLFDESH